MGHTILLSTDIDCTLYLTRDQNCCPRIWQSCSDISIVKTDSSNNRPLKADDAAASRPPVPVVGLDAFARGGAGAGCHVKEWRSVQAPGLRADLGY